MEILIIKPYILLVSAKFSVTLNPKSKFGKTQRLFFIFEIEIDCPRLIANLVLAIGLIINNSLNQKEV